MVRKLFDKMPKKPHVALINNLGGTSVLEMNVLLNEVRHSDIAPLITHIIGPSALMTSLDMHGISISVFPADDGELALLKQHTPISAWPKLSEMSSVQILALPDGWRRLRRSLRSILDAGFPDRLL